MEISSKPGDPLRGFHNVMSDGTKVVTEIVSDSDHGSIHLCLYLITQNIRDFKDMVVGFDTEWTFVDVGTGKMEARVVLIKLFSCIGCVLIRLDHKSGPVCPSLKKFLIMKDVIFVGIQIREDLMKLKENFGIEIRNVVELTELAVNVLRKQRLSACGPRDLAREVLKVGVEQRPQDVIWTSWAEESLTPEQIECATIDAYLTYKTGKKLLSRD
ncbi:hypothetical protein ACE6H2_014786 [Prunus campanulata]